MVTAPKRQFVPWPPRAQNRAKSASALHALPACLAKQASARARTPVAPYTWSMNSRAGSGIVTAPSAGAMHAACMVAYLGGPPRLFQQLGVQPGMCLHLLQPSGFFLSHEAGFGFPAFFLEALACIETGRESDANARIAH